MALEDPRDAGGVAFVFVEAGEELAEAVGAVAGAEGLEGAELV